MDDAEQTAPAATAATAATTALAAEDLAAVRELARRAHPDAVPELIGGENLAEVMASVEPARAAYRRIAAAIATPPVPPSPVPTVPAGSAPPLVIDLDALPTTEKIRRGLAAKPT